MSDDTILIPLDRIVVGPRLRHVDLDWATLLAASFEESGQHTPIQVGPEDPDGNFPLIAGAHRVKAAEIAGFDELRAIVFAGNDLQRKLLEIDENLMRRELSELDRAVFLAERKAVFEALNPSAKHGGLRKRGDQVEENFHLIPRQGSFAAETAKKLGISDRQVRTYLLRAAIPAELRARLAGTRWADHGATLDALAKAEPAKRAALVNALVRTVAPAATFAAALAEVDGRLAAIVSVDDAQLARLQGAWRKAGAKARRLFLASILRDNATERLVCELQDEAIGDQDRALAAIGGKGRG